MQQKVTPFIWFEENAEEAMNFYISTFNNSKIIDIERHTGDRGIPGEDKLKGKVLTGIFEIEGMRFMCLDGGPLFKPGGNISFMVEFDTQEQLDKVWDKLNEAGTPMQCGWITDKFGTTWQIVPKSLGEMWSDPNATKAQKDALDKAMLPMIKLDVAELEKAFSDAK